MGNGGGNTVMIVRNAVAGIDLSSEWVVLILVTLCTKGDRTSAGNLRTRAPTLQITSMFWQFESGKEVAYHLIA